MRMTLYGYLLLFGALMFTAITPIAYVLGNGINPVALMLLVSLAGTLISFWISYWKGTLRHVKVYFTTKNGMYAILSFGILAYTLLSLIFSYVTHYVNADLVAVVYRSWPLMLVLMAPLLMQERMTKYDAAGVIVGFLGLAVTLVGGTAISIPAQYLPFVLLLLLGAFFDAFVSGVSKRYQYELTSSIFAYNAVSFAIFVPVALLSGSFNFIGFTSQTALAVLILGVVQNVLLTFLFVASFRRVKTSIASNVLIASPFFTMLLSAAFLKTPIEPYYVIAAVGVAFGILIQRLQPKAANYISKRRKVPLFDVTSAFVGTKSDLIYNAIRGEGRALAFCVDSGAVREFLERNASERGNGERALIFTDRKPHPDVRKAEMDFIKEILGAEENQVVFVGIGKPSEVELGFEEIDERIHGQENSKGQFVKS